MVSGRGIVFQECSPCAGWSGLSERRVCLTVSIEKAATNRRSHGRRQALLDDLGVDWLGVAVSRSDVENRDISTTLGTLSGLLDTDATVRRFRGRVNVSFDGFDDDPREIYEIPEIRRFCAELDARFPYWLYFLSMEDSSLKMMTFCLCRVEKQRAGASHAEQHRSWPVPLFPFRSNERAISSAFSGRSDEPSNQ